MSEHKHPPHIAVVGGGAAGLMAAYAAAREGASVTIVERCERAGRKLLATGNGRCNLTNLRASPEHYHGTGQALAAEALLRVPPSEALTTFSSLGLVWREEEKGRVYPYSGQASAVLDVLRAGCARYGVTLACGQAVRSITRGEDGFSLQVGEGDIMCADRVIVTTGGRAASKLGSDGSGYALLTALGHHMTPCAPSLVQLRCTHPVLPALKGIRVQARITLRIGHHTAREEYGEILFTEYGLSGIAALSVSREVSPAIAAGRTVEASLCLLPEYDAAQRKSMMLDRRRLFADETAGQCCMGLLPRRVGEALCKTAGIPLDLPCARLSDAQASALAALLADWQFPVIGTQSFEHAQVTAGGIDGNEFAPGTMASRLVPGLYAAGEVLDVDGDCGGFNLQFAWASGLLAGRAAATTLA